MLALGATCLSARPTRASRSLDAGALLNPNIWSSDSAPPPPVSGIADADGLVAAATDGRADSSGCGESCANGSQSSGMVPLIEILLLAYKPNYTWPGLIIVLLGLPVYFIWRRKATI